MKERKEKKKKKVIIHITFTKWNLLYLHARVNPFFVYPVEEISQNRSYRERKGGWVLVPLGPAGLCNRHTLDGPEHKPALTSAHIIM